MAALNQQVASAKRNQARRGSLVLAACAALLVVAASLGAARVGAAEPPGRFTDCAAALSHFHEAALGTPMFIDLPPGWSEEDAEAYAASEASDAVVEAPASDAAQDDGFETAVFETDGRRIYALLPEALWVLELRGDRPEIVASMELKLGSGVKEAFPSDLILVGAKAFLFRSVRYDVPKEFPSDGLEIIELDVNNPRRPSLVRTLSISGRLVSVRHDRANLQLVITHDGVADWWVWHEYDKALRFESNHDFEHWVRSSTIDVWLPSYSFTERSNSSSKWAPLVPCERVMLYDYTVGNDVRVLLSFDANRGLARWGAVALAAWPWPTYQIANAAYVVDYGTQETHVHRFDLSGPDSTAYHGKASVAGGLVWDERLDRTSLSEYKGYLRIVSSIEYPPEEESGRVTTFAIEPEGLRRVATFNQLDSAVNADAVRFLRERAYVVSSSTAVLDLSEPKASTVLGQLSVVRDFFDGLQVFPLSDRFVLTVGDPGRFDFDSDPATVVSLFDLIDPQHPIELDSIELLRLDRDHWFNAPGFEYRDGTAIVPIGLRFGGYGVDWDVPWAVYMLRVRRDGLQVLGTIETPSPLRDSVQVGSRRVLFTEHEIGGFDIATNTVLDWTKYEHLILLWNSDGLPEPDLPGCVPWPAALRLLRWTSAPVYWPLCP